MNEKYFVVSILDEPQQLFFDKKSCLKSLKEAENSSDYYVDSFDEDGIKVEIYGWDPDKQILHEGG